jgi:hypothetical protein
VTLVLSFPLCNFTTFLIAAQNHLFGMHLPWGRWNFNRKIGVNQWEQTNSNKYSIPNWHYCRLKQFTGVFLFFFYPGNLTVQNKKEWKLELWYHTTKWSVHFVTSWMQVFLHQGNFFNNSRVPEYSGRMNINGEVSCKIKAIDGEWFVGNRKFFIKERDLSNNIEVAIPCTI